MIKSPRLHFQIADLLSQGGQQLLSAPDTRAQKGQIRIVAGEALGEPKRTGVVPPKVISDFA